VVTTGGSGATGALAVEGAEGAAEAAGPAAVAAAAGAVPAGAGLGSASLLCGAPEEAVADFGLDGVAPSAWPAGVRVEGAPEQPATVRPPAAAAKIALKPAATTTLPPKPCFIARSG
jgi:hypothetical protein